MRIEAYFLHCRILFAKKENDADEATSTHLSAS